MSDCLSVLKSAREAELEVKSMLEQVKLFHGILNLKGRTREWAERTVEKIAELETELNRQIDEAVDRKREAVRVLSALSGAEKAALYQYYILARDWSEIADELYFSERQIYNIRKRAMAHLCERYESVS
ncbi:MAG: hypothetical protein K2N06_09305 [Oscillospiraceae bacterium]|nr:hypothetical protein [Oscillospiraceae bacterium]